MAKQDKTKAPSKRYYRKRVELFRLIEKIKLWPSHKGILHGIRVIEILGDQARITTHCNHTFMVNNSRNSRAARWLRNKWFKGVCSGCRVPDWKLSKYSATMFRRHHGSLLLNENQRVSGQGSESSGR
jgi:pyrrolysyl-tRNA synthetase-like protein